MNEKIFIRPQINSVSPTTSQPIAKPTTGPSFDSIFQDKLGENDIKFSAHAVKRLESRNITLTPKDMALLKDAVNKAETKGAKESLIVMDKLALVVSIKNRTVITAVDGNSLKDNVFTNIDSAVIAKQ